MSTASSKRQSIPEMDTKAEVPAIDNPKPSIWTRIKIAVKKTAAVIVKPFKAAAKKMQPVAKRVSAYARYVAYRVKHAVRPVTNFISKLWHRALKPMCQFVLLTVAVTTLFIAAYLAPWATVLTLIVAAGMAFMFASVLSGIDEIRQELPQIP